jgi:tetratricopeptide (TPR) repeat protein
METLNPHQLVKEAQTEYQNKQYLSAAQLYKAAAEGFLASGDELEAARQANNCSVAYLKGGNAKLALEAASGTQNMFARYGDIKGQAMAIGNQAAALERLKRYEDALAAYERSAEWLKEAGETELRAYVLQSISSLQLRKRQYLEAYATMRAGIMGLKKPNFRQRLLKTLIQIPYNFLK